MNRIYMDYSATTPLDPDVLEAMMPYLRDQFGNPSSRHTFGRATRVAIDQARSEIASTLNADPEEIYFTSGGTEADNMAIKGIALKLRDRGNHIVTNLSEHHAVLRSCQYLESLGYRVTYLAPDAYGQIEASAVEEAIEEDTILITIMHANNETGTINPIAKIGRIARNHDIAFHTDAAQSYGKLIIDVRSQNIDLLTISSHKFYGPKGMGVLYCRSGLQVSPLFHGGEHERGRRAGTENIAGIIGLAKAAQLMHQRQEADRLHLTKLRQALVAGISESLKGIHINGHPQDRLPHIVNISFDGVEGEALLMALDLKGIAVSSGSACTAGSAEPSHVLRSMGIPDQRAQSSLRFSLGHPNTREEVDYAVRCVIDVVNRLRSFSPITMEQ